MADEHFLRDNKSLSLKATNGQTVNEIKLCLKVKTKLA